MVNSLKFQGRTAIPLLKLRSFTLAPSSRSPFGFGVNVLLVHSTKIAHGKRYDVERGGLRQGISEVPKVSETESVEYGRERVEEDENEDEEEEEDEEDRRPIGISDCVSGTCLGPFTVY